jgi:outer membrane protein
LALAGGAALRPAVDWSAIGPTWASLTRRQPLFEGADYVTTESDAITYGSSLEMQQLLPTGGALRLETSVLHVDLDQTTIFPDEFEIPLKSGGDPEFRVDTRQLQGGVSLAISQPLFSLNRFRHTDKEVQVKKRQADLVWKMERGKVLLRSAKEYLDYQTRRAELAGRRERRGLIANSVTAAEHDLEDGTGSEMLLRQRRLDLGREEIAVVQAEAELETAAVALRLALALSAAEELRLPADTIAVDLSLVDLESGAAALIGNRSDLKQLEARITEQQLQEQEQSDRLGWKISFIGSLGFTGFGRDLDEVRSSWGLNEVEVGIGASVPLWDGGLKALTVAGLRAERRSRELDLELAQRGAITEIQTLRRGLRTAESIWRLTQENLVLARENLHVARQEHEDGYLSERQLQEVELALVDLRAEAVAARARVVRAALELGNAMGREPQELLP